MGPGRVRENRAAVRLSQGTALLFPPDWRRDRSSGASAPQARRAEPGPRAWATAPGAARAWGAESRKPGRGAANSVNSEGRGELIHRVPLLAPTSAALRSPPRRGKFEAEVCRFLSPLGGSSRNQEAGAAPPGAARGTPSGGQWAAGLELAASVRVRACVSARPTVCVPSPGLREQTAWASPRAVLAQPAAP